MRRCSFASARCRREISALESLGVAAFPDMIAAIGVELQVQFALGLEHVIEPRIVAPVGLTTIALSGFLALRNSSTASVLRRGFQRNQIWIPAREWSAAGVQAARAQRLRFLHIRDAKALQRLDRLRGVILHSLEDDHAIAGRFDLLVPDLELGPTPSSWILPRSGACWNRAGSFGPHADRRPACPFRTGIPRPAFRRRNATCPNRARHAPL
jgi:hypothetical protein